MPCRLFASIRENGATSGVGVLAAYAYDDLGRRTSVTFGNGSVQGFGYDAVSRLSTLTNDLGGSATAHDLTQTFTYNPASQIASVVRSNDAYAWQAHYNVDRSYTIDGLNRIMTVGSTAVAYDGRGNLTSDGTNGFTYTAENLLKTGPGGTTLAYDPLGRLYETVKSPTTTRLLYDGVDLIGEYNGSNAVQRRYVLGPGTDNPIGWYEGSGTSDRRFLMADERGSVVSVTDSAGATINLNAYDEYGIPAPGNAGRFGYTGQTWLPELGMWYYKARMYSPTLGRFLQTDPIGYGDGMNWYNYVGSDPVNGIDPTGLEKCDPGFHRGTETGSRLPKCLPNGVASADGSGSGSTGAGGSGGVMGGPGGVWVCVKNCSGGGQSGVDEQGAYILVETRKYIYVGWAPVPMTQYQHGKLTAKCNALGPMSGDPECDAIPDQNWQLPVGNLCLPAHSCSRGRPYIVPNPIDLCPLADGAAHASAYTGMVGTGMSFVPHPVVSSAGKLIAAGSGAVGTIATVGADISGCK